MQLAANNERIKNSTHTLSEDNHNDKPLQIELQSKRASLKHRNIVESRLEPVTSKEHHLPLNFSRQCTIHSLCLRGGGKRMVELDEPRGVLDSNPTTYIAPLHLELGQR
jgi:hypothetical protein